jgi:hypothetical protein
VKAFFRRALERWKVIAARIALVQTTIILFVIYFGLFSIMALLAFLTRRDLLDKRLVPAESYWKDREFTEPHPQQYRHQF